MVRVDRLVVFQTGIFCVDGSRLQKRKKPGIKGAPAFVRRLLAGCRTRQSVCDLEPVRAIRRDAVAISMAIAG